MNQRPFIIKCPCCGGPSNCQSPKCLKVSKNLVEVLKQTYIPTPTETIVNIQKDSYKTPANCPRCGSKLVDCRSDIQKLVNKYGGVMSCETSGCNYTIGKLNYISQNLFPIQALPEALPIYDKEPEE